MVHSLMQGAKTTIARPLAQGISIHQRTIFQENRIVWPSFFRVVTPINTPQKFHFLLRCATCNNFRQQLFSVSCFQCRQHKLITRQEKYAIRDGIFPPPKQTYVNKSSWCSSKKQRVVTTAADCSMACGVADCSRLHEQVYTAVLPLYGNYPILGDPIPSLGNTQGNSKKA